ncbi:hypothetical protein AS850_14115 [Frondihabitans sp. 762G35]|uniref:hypothetical protein n=1 Tax=Frondihabitans sp. 762G35 TaxID=1446794 RepID=UPI000D21B4BB|nr:hypothetical protein [Frondihabitans sp. 762G35]ARC58216.1 hypothetical protein AS850_14115 [Frondihabitans sp. 762G35]
MATRRQFVDVVRGVTSSFCSRNNDYRGVWLPGVLCAQTLPDDRVLIDLLDTRDAGPLTATVQERYRELAYSIMYRSGLPAAMLTHATIEVRFTSRLPSWTREDWKSPRELLPRPTWWFTATATITDDRGRSYTADDTDWCWPESRTLPTVSLYDPAGTLLL